MQSVQNPISMEVFSTKHLFMAVVRYLENQEIQKAEELLHFITQEDARRKGEIQSLVFAKAFAKRITHQMPLEENLYLRAGQLPQIDLFNFMAHRFPLVSEARRISNEYLYHFMRDTEEVTLLDLGIGTGQQEEELLRLLSRRSACPSVLRIVAIEPAEGSLIEAEETLTSLAQSLGLTVEFYPIPKKLEELSSLDWEYIQNIPGKLIINEAFAVHHIADQAGRDRRNLILAILRDLNPSAFILSEPNSDHLTKNLMTRFQNAWRHFNLVFQLVDRLKCAEIEKKALKIHFFGREIEDIIGNCEEKRTERHETAEMWLNRLTSVGFSPLRDFSLLPGEGGGGGVALTRRHDYISLDVEGESVVAILCVV